MATTLTAAIVLAASGMIDRDATMASFKDVLDKHILDREMDSAVVGEAVEAVLRENPNTRFNLPALGNYGAQKLGYTPSSFVATSEKVQDYVRSNASADPDAGAIFCVTKGKSNLGVAKWSSLTEEEIGHRRELFVASQARKAAKPAKA